MSDQTRRRRSESRRRKYLIGVRVDSNDYARIAALATAEGLSMPAALIVDAERRGAAAVTR